MFLSNDASQFIDTDLESNQSFAFKAFRMFSIFLLLFYSHIKANKLKSLTYRNIVDGKNVVFVCF